MNTCKHCGTDREPGESPCCDGATLNVIMDLLAAFRGRRAVTAADLSEADGWLDAWEL